MVCVGHTLLRTPFFDSLQHMLDTQSNVSYHLSNRINTDTSWTCDGQAGQRFT